MLRRGQGADEQMFVRCLFFIECPELGPTRIIIFLKKYSVVPSRVSEQHPRLRSELNIVFAVVTRFIFIPFYVFLLTESKDFCSPPMSPVSDTADCDISWCHHREEAARVKF